MWWYGYLFAVVPNWVYFHFILISSAFKHFIYCGFWPHIEIAHEEYIHGKKTKEVEEEEEEESIVNRNENLKKFL
jgi:hypothetical protein